MSTPTPYEPYTYYSVTWKCTTPDCRNYNIELAVPEVYSNNGTNLRVVCGVCGNDGQTLTATKLDPQPEVV